MEQVKPILARAASYHKKVADYARRVRLNAPNEHIRLIAGELADRARFVHRQLKDFAVEETTANKVWVQFAPAYHLERIIDGLEIDPEITADELIGTASELERRMAKYYSQLSESAPTEALRELFANLAKAGQQHQRSLNDLSRMS